MRVSALSRRDIETLSGGIRRRGRLLSITVVPFSTKAITCVVSKKACAQAHSRNALKRKLRMLLRELLVGSEKVAIIVRAERSAKDATIGELRDELRILVDDALNRMK